MKRYVVQNDIAFCFVKMHTTINHIDTQDCMVHWHLYLNTDKSAGKKLNAL